MLTGLQIENIAIIEKLSVDFSRGLNILTGETGAGKSILIDSVHAVTGEKTSRELLRTGAQRASVSAMFTDISLQVTQRLSELGIPNEPDGSVLLQRTLNKDGKSTCRINGLTVTLTMLRSVAYTLINIHGQRDSQALLDSERHIDFLDEYAECENELLEYRNVFHRINAVKAQINRLTVDESEKLRRTEMLSYQIEELTRADIQIGEMKELRHKKAVIENSVKLKQAIASAVHALLGDADGLGAASLLTSAAADIQSVLPVQKGLAPVWESVNNAADQAEDAASVLEDVLSQLDSLDSDMDYIEERLDLMFRLSRKYGATEEEMLAFLHNAQKEKDEITLSDEKIIELTAELQRLTPVLQEKALNLSKKRRAAAKRLSAQIEAELHYLDMPHAVFVTEISQSTPGENGCDRVEFTISANPGVAPKPLGKVASGGELSRMMLAMKNVLSEKSGASTLIFDEIDSGVSGTAAGKIAEKLASLSEKVQVICITHSGQIAAFADDQKLLQKQVEQGKTFTTVTDLDNQQRAEVIAHITFGEHFTPQQLLSARQMMDEARRKKNKTVHHK